MLPTRSLRFYCKPTLIATAVISSFTVNAQLMPTATTEGVAADSEKTKVARPQRVEPVTITGQNDRYKATGTTGAKIDAPLRDIPQAINVIPEQLIKDQGARSIQDVLKNVPGVGFSLGDGQRDQFTIRGFSAIADQYVDGVRDDSLYYRSLYNVNELEVIKGPASVLYGRGSSGGIVNRVTKKPFFGAAYEVSATTGSFSQKNVQMDLNAGSREGSTAFRMLGEWEDSGSFRNNGFLKKANVNPQLLTKVGNDGLLLLSVEHTEDRRLLDFGIPALNGKPADLPIRQTFTSSDPKANDYNQSRVDSIASTFDYTFAPTLSFKNNFRYYDYTLDRNQTVVNTVDIAGANALDPKAVIRRSNVRRHDVGFFNQAELTQKASFAGTQHLILYGVEISRQNRDQYFINQILPTLVSIRNPVLPTLPFTVTSTSPGVQFAARTTGTGDYNATGIYVQDMITLTPQLKALLGLRHDTFLQQYTDYAPNTTTNPVRLPFIERTDKALSPRAGLVWQPTDAQSYYASFSKSFQPSGGDIAIAAGQDAFAPEITKNYEVGGKFDLLNKRIAATVSVFKLQRDNIKASFVPAGAPVGTAAQIFNIGQQSVKGIEATAAGSVGDGWAVSSGIAALDPVISRSGAFASPNLRPAVTAVSLLGKRPTITPTLTANLWISKDLGGGFSAAGGVNHISGTFADAANTVKIPSYTVADIGLYYRQITKTTSGFDIAINMKNVTNTRYYVSAQSDVSIMPGAPRTFELNVRYKF